MVEKFFDNEINKLYDNFLNDEDVKKLIDDRADDKPNIFQILKVTNAEIRHSNFLSWLLDPSSNHNLGDVVLKGFIKEIINTSDIFDDEFTVENINFEDVEVRREWENIDLLIKVDSYIFCIENKIFSGEHSDQLRRYKNKVEETFPKLEKIYIYLNPQGISSFEESDVYLPISYQAVIDILDNIDYSKVKNFNDITKSFIDQYLVTLKRDIMGIEENSELAEKIYSKHRELFDYIFEIKPDGINNINQIIRECLQSKGYKLGSVSKAFIRFHHPEMEKFVYINSSPNGWSKRETFTHEISLYSLNNKNELKMYLGMSDMGDDEYDRARLNEILQELDPEGGTQKRWKNYQSKTYSFDVLSKPKTDKEILKDFEKILDDYKSNIDSVIKHLNKNKKELLDLKSNKVL